MGTRQVVETLGARAFCFVVLTTLANAACGGGDDDAAGGSGTGGATSSGSGGAHSGGAGVTSSGGSGGAGGVRPGGSGGDSAGGTGGVTPDAGTDADAGSGPASPGIAARHPGDLDIESDPDVIFADDFESYADASELWDRWDNTYQEAQTRITTEPANVYAGDQALEFTLPAQDEELSNAVQKVLTTELDAMYLRWYAKFEGNNDIVGSSHNGGGMSAHYFVNGNATPGVRADGMNKFLVEYEHWRGEASDASPGLLNVYVYHPEQRDDYGDHFFPSGLVMPNTSLPFDFGPDFEPHSEITPDLDRWYCYELMVKANTPGELDGHITIWLDGEQVADFGNLRMRDVDTLKIDRFNLSFHTRATPTQTRRFYDNVVAATSYIGPLAPQ